MNRSRVTGDLASHGNIFVDIANDRVGIGSTIPGQKLSLPDNAKIALGNSADQQLYHDGTLGHLQNNTGHFVNDISGHFYVRNLDGVKSRIIAKSNGAVELYYNGTKMLETNIPSGHNGEVILGQKVHVRHTGSGNGEIFPSSGNLYLNAKDGETSILCVRDAGVHLTFDNTTKFTTQAYGINVTGTTDTDGLVVAGITTMGNRLNVAAGIDITASTSNLYATDGTLSYYATNNGVYLNGAGANGWLRLNAAGSANDRTSINLKGHSASGGDIIYFRTNSTERLKIASTGSITVSGTISPTANNTYDLGGSSTAWSHIYGVDLTLTDTTADSAAGPEFKLFRNSASPADADYLGQIKFAGESSTGVERNYAKITGKILDVTNGAEDGIIEFAHIKNGSQVITGRFRSDSLQLLNGTNFSVAGTSDFTGDATFSGGAGAVTVAAGSDISFTNSTTQWTGDNLAKIQHFNNVLYISGGTGGIIFREAGTSRWRINGDGHFIPEQGDGTLDIGTNSVRVRNGYFDTLYGNGSNITNVDADTLDGQQGSYYRNATNLNAGTIDDARLPGTITSNISGTANNSEALKIVDTRNDGARVPNDYAAHKVTAEFTNQVINGWWSAITVKGWANGYAPWQLWGKSDTTQNINLYARFGHGGNNTWSSLYTIWHSGVDGSGSGLDADTLDGVQASSFVRSDANDTASGQITLTSSSQYALNINNSHDGKIVLQGSTDPYIRFREGTTDKAFIQWHSDGYLMLRNQEDSSSIRLSDDLLYSNNGFASGSIYRMWHAGNDGAGSGLDADTLDGVEGASYLRSDANDTASGQITLTSSSQYPLKINSGSSDGKIVLQGSSNPYIRWQEGTTDKAYIQWHSSGKIIIANQETNERLDIGSGSSGLEFLVDGSAKTVWHSGNDGSGSGLDADLWDGQQFASYLNQALLTSSTVNFSRVNVTGSHGISNDGWFRNSTSGEGLYNTATTQHFYSDDDDYWNIAGGTGANGIRFRDDSGGTIRGYVYCNSSSQIGFLNQGGNWTLRTTTAGITRLGSNQYQLVDGNVSNNLYLLTGTSGSSGLSAFNSSSQWRWQIYGDGTSYGFLDGNWAGWDIKKTINGAFYVDEGSGLARVWNSLNDGSGSGLDADTLDGTQANALVRSGAQSSVSGWHISAYRNGSGTSPVSYTHLTLPTILLV